MQLHSTVVCTKVCLYLSERESETSHFREQLYWLNQFNDAVQQQPSSLR